MAHPSRAFEFSASEDTSGVWDRSPGRGREQHLVLERGVPRHSEPVIVVEDQRRGNRVSLDLFQGDRCTQKIGSLFDPVHRGAVRRQSDGLRLGLYITDQIVRRGRLRVKSDVARSWSRCRRAPGARSTAQAGRVPEEQLDEGAQQARGSARSGGAATTQQDQYYFEHADELAPKAATSSAKKRAQGSRRTRSAGRSHFYPPRTISTVTGRTWPKLAVESGCRSSRGRQA